MTRARGTAERGSAAAEFALTVALVMVLFLAALQLGFGLHVRNSAISQMVEAARHGARSGHTTADAEQRALELLGGSVSGPTDVAARVVERDGVLVMEVTAAIPLPVLGPLGPPSAVTVTGHAFVEDQR